MNKENRNVPTAKPEVKKEALFERKPRATEHIDVARLEQAFGVKRHRRGNASM